MILNIFRASSQNESCNVVNFDEDCFWLDYFALSPIVCGERFRLKYGTDKMNEIPECPCHRKTEIKVMHA